MKNTMTYQKALDELNRIVAEIDREEIPLDQLTGKINRAGELLEFCRTKLRETEEAFEAGLKKMED